MSDPWKQCAVPTDLYAHLRTAGATNIQVFQRGVEDGHLTVIVAHEPQGWHLSVSHRSSRILDPVTQRPAAGRYPGWDEIVEARRRFLPDEIYVAQILPPAAKHVNAMPTCFHLWEIPTAVGEGLQA